MCSRGVLDVDHRDQILAITDAPQLAALCSFDQSRNELRVSRSPNQMRSQRTGRESILAVGGEHRLLGQSFAVRVVAEELRRIRQRLVCAEVIVAVVDNARRTREDEASDAVPPTTLASVLRQAGLKK